MRFSSKSNNYLEVKKYRYGLLTNGKEIKIYQKLQYDIQLLFQCSGKDVETKLENIKDLIGRESLIQEHLVEKP